jgi:hypothetical protein
MWKSNQNQPHWKARAQCWSACEKMKDKGERCSRFEAAPKDQFDNVGVGEAGNLGKWYHRLDQWLEASG